MSVSEAAAVPMPLRFDACKSAHVGSWARRERASVSNLMRYIVTLCFVVAVALVTPSDVASVQ